MLKGYCHVSKTTDSKPPYDPYCKRTVDDIPEYVIEATMEGMTPSQFARDDGTYNAETNEVCCTECYMELGQPSGPRGWQAGWPIP
jgi:hypothetical protein